MSDFAYGYVPEEYKNGVTLFDDGDYDMKIVSCVDKVSQAQNPMRVVSMKVKGQDATLDFYLVKNEYFNSSMTKFFDCFGIRLGDFEIQHWIGRVGRGHIAQEEYTTTSNKKGKSMKIKYLIVNNPTPNIQSRVNQQAQDNQRFTQPAQAQAKTGEFEDDIPF